MYILDMMRLLFGIIFIASYIDLVRTCARMSDSGETETITTTTTTTTETPITCPQVSGQVLLYEDNSLTFGSDFYGEVDPISTCETCSTGKEVYYPDSGNPVIQAFNQKAIGGVNCADYCVCTASGTCYQRSTPTSNIVLYPYCDGSVCSTYVLVLSENGDEGIISTDSTSLITAVSQIDGTGVNLPVTQEGVYPKVTAASCNGCNFAQSC